MSIKRSDLELAVSDDVRSTRLVLEKRQLTEVVTSIIFHDFFALGVTDPLRGTRLSVDEKEEGTAVLSLLDDVLARLVDLLLDGISKLRSLIVAHAL